MAGPRSVVGSLLGLGRTKPDDVLTVMFTSGTTGRPKGVMLTHRNVGSNIDALDEILGLRQNDVMLGILPFFHSFGYTATLWTMLTMDPKGVYHPSPLEPRAIGQLSRQHGTTILVATPTFLRSYLRRCEPEDFAKLEVVFVGAEKLPEELADAFEQRFGVRPYEGYGATELSPVAAGNIPPNRGPGAVRQGCRSGTVGRPLPGVTAKIVDLETMQDLEPSQAGMLLFKGPNVMKGYLDQPDQTAEVIRDGWYVTGDVAVIDADGFIRITDRLSRFSKIGGEMVPHLRVEEAIATIIGAGVEYPRIAVTSIPDGKKGERLIVLHTDLGKSAEEVCRGLRGGPSLTVDSLARQLPPGRGTSRLCNRQIGPERNPPDGAGTIQELGKAKTNMNVKLPLILALVCVAGGRVSAQVNLLPQGNFENPGVNTGWAEGFNIPNNQEFRVISENGKHWLRIENRDAGRQLDYVHAFVKVTPADRVADRLGPHESHEPENRQGGLAHGPRCPDVRRRLIRLPGRCSRIEGRLRLGDEIGGTEGARGSDAPEHPARDVPLHRRVRDRRPHGHAPHRRAEALGRRRAAGRRRAWTGTRPPSKR